MSTKPLLCLLRITAQALYCEPKPSRVVRDRKMDDLVRDEVAEYEVRREDKPPVEREVSSRRTVSPLGALTHHVDPLHGLSKARGDTAHLVLDLCTRLLSQPVLEAAG